MKIGMVGIGQMGGRMARRVLDGGYSLFLHDLNKETAKPLIEKGAKWKETPRGIAEACEVTITCLPNPQDVEEVVSGMTGLMSGWKQGSIYIDMSTNSPSTVRRIAATAKDRGVEMLDAPVSGGVGGAEAGTLTIMVGGEASTLEKIHPLLQTMGKNIFHVGPLGCGSITKIINNMMVTTCNAITAECFVLGVKAGMDPKLLREVIRTSSGGNFWLERNMPRIFEGNFAPGFRLALALKDIGLAMGLAREYGVIMPVSVAVEQRFREAEAAGLGDQGSQVIIRRLEELAGVQVRAQGT